MAHLRTFTDTRGSLTLATCGEDIPFEIHRAYWIHDVPKGEVRGEHANVKVHEFVVCVHGSVSIDVESATDRQTYHLRACDEGIIIPAESWSRQYNFSPDAVLMVLASGEYHAQEYINDYPEWKRHVAMKQNPHQE